MRRAAFGLLLLLVGCHGSEVETANVDDAGAEVASEGGTIVADTSNAEACPKGMIYLPAARYCIDATEVTDEAYNAFLKADPRLVAPQIPKFCEGRRAYSPLRFSTTFPAADVEWCHAYEYCKWAGKRLCGRRGGGPLTDADGTSTAVSQWSYACKGGEPGTAYPYGADYVDQKCAITPKPLRSQTVDGSAYKDCVGGFPGLKHMSGNLAEWEDACSPGEPSLTTVCRIRGGSYQSDPAGGKCETDAGAVITTKAPTVGFRCCADL